MEEELLIENANNELIFAYDRPDTRDYSFDDFEQFASGDNNVKKWPRNKLVVQNQYNTPACTMFSGIHVSDALNILEDEKLGVSRPQTQAMPQWVQFCSERGYANSGSSIQTVGLRLKKKGFIEGFVTIPNSLETIDMAEKMAKAIDIGTFISTGSAYGDWGTIKKTGVYSERVDRKFTGHGFCIGDYVRGEDGNIDFFWGLTSWGDKWGIYGGYFKIPVNMITKLYSKLCFIDKDDSNLFNRFEEIQKVKQAISLLRDVYHNTHIEDVKTLLEEKKLGESFSNIYGIII